MGHRWATLVERLRGSLFFVPMVYVLGAVLVSELTVTADRSLFDDRTELPFRLTTTVEGARSVLSTVASATLTFAGIAFSVALLVFQLASSQYSPRVVHGLFRDPFNKQVMGVVVGTFTYCLLVLRAVRGSVEAGGDPVIPHVSVGIAVVLGIATVLAVVAFINHAAHRMDVSEILQGITRGTLRRLPAEAEPSEPEAAPVTTDGHGFVVRFGANGWIQQVDPEGLLRLVGPGGLVTLHSVPGRYAIAGTPLCTVWPPPPPAEREEVARRARAAVDVGDTRTMQQDASYGLRQIVDVALRALSPGVNDPTTAQDAIFHAAAVLRELLEAPEVRTVPGEDGRRLLITEASRPDELVGLAFDEVRLAAADKPAVCIYLLEALSLLVEALRADGRDALCDPLLRQAAEVVRGASLASLPEGDVEQVREAYAKRFAPE
ncbi:MAG: DUF2254 domain-containing protein [Acidimicrobiia bacterium]|nr:DUF2254 domain-containing protein [Acidimicrobiia bacterium]